MTTLNDAIHALGEWDITTITTIADVTVLFGHNQDQTHGEVTLHSPGKIVICTNSADDGLYEVDTTFAHVKAAHVCFAFPSFASKEDAKLALEVQPEDELSVFRFV